MLLSEEWLREWINPQQDIQQIAYDLTQAGLEVEKINNPSTDHLQQVIVAEILESEQHPNADRLKLCKVNDGTQELSIVCGAPNARAGIKVALAAVGTILPGDFKIKESKIRGSLSQGMLCSAKELQLSDEHQGILELPADAQLGKEVSEYLKLPSTTLDIAITPNRGDCLSIRGIARDLAVLYAEHSVKQTPPALPQISPQHKDELPIELLAPESCPGYYGRIVKGIDLSKESPEWMQQRLRDSGLNPINIAVDVTNYVMQELGQPLHAFDLRRLTGGIKVRLATKGEELTLLDDSVMKLDEEVLLIADHEKPLALGGIMGGKDSGIADDTTDVFLEAAVFNPKNIFRTRQKYNLSTEAAYRFERFVDPTLPQLAIERATELLIATAGGEAGPISSGINEKHLLSLSNHPSLTLQRDFIAKFLGFSLSDKQITSILEGLGFTLKPIKSQQDGWQVAIPNYRPDIDCPEALCEELARVYGYDKIEQTLPRGALKPQHFQATTSTDDEVRSFLTARGFSEVVNYSFISKEESELFYPELKPLELANPISSDLSAMRPALLPGLLKNLAYNQRRQVNACNLFEMGLCFIPKDKGSTQAQDENDKLAQNDNLDANDNLSQNNYLSFVAMRPQSGKTGKGGKGGKASKHTRQEYKYDLDDLLTDVTDMFSLWGLKQGGEVVFVYATSPSTNIAIATTIDDSHLFHPSKHISIIRRHKKNHSVIGKAGLLHPRLLTFPQLSKLQGYDLYACTLCLDDLPERPIPAYKPFSDLPTANFELSLIVPEILIYADLEKIINKSFTQKPDKIELLDVYQSDKLPAGYKSIALLLKWRPTDATLTDEQVNTLVFDMIKKLEANHDIKLRS
ncbi:MAG: phenylalanine--tRNA ligase subunit beta [Candidatus Portiera sp.]|nr:phenylalanine--tRNA ligase subunit beta [Portiera sp.]